MKKCSICKIEKPYDSYLKNKRSKDGFGYQCKECRSNYKSNYDSKNKQKTLEYAREYRKKNKQKVLEYARQYRKDNKDKIRKSKNEYKKNRMSNDPVYKLQHTTSKQIWKALKKRGHNKTGSVWEALPYTSKQLCEHLESQFDDKMSWDNYGTYWHIDHIYPQSELPYENYEDPNFQKCWALDNLRPLEASENIAKSNKIL